MKKNFIQIPLFSLLIYISIIIFISENIFSQWIPQSVPINKSIEEIKFVDEYTGWAVTTSAPEYDTAYILHTTNGGNTWDVQFIGDDLLFYSLEAIDSDVAYVGAAIVSKGYPAFLSTTNGGANGTLSNIQVGIFFNDIYFLNKDTGYSCGYILGWSLALTTNGGVNWTPRQDGLMVNGQPRTLFFLNSDTGFCGGSTKLFKTTNAGINWFELFNFGPFNNRQPLKIQFLNNDIGWVGLTSNGVGVTTNGGINWTITNPATIGTPSIQSVYFIDNSIGWSGRMSPIIYKSTDGGFNWISQTDSAGSRTIHMNDSLLGWSGYLGIAKTTNGGLMFISSIGSGIPNGYKLYQNYPNPFNPVTSIRFEISRLSEIKLNVFNILGQKVATLLDQRLSPGVYEFTWRASDLSSGIYFYTLETEGFKDTKKLVLLK
jgi:photosystem II stability/assembly factor-like uncharacterized protein